MKGERHKWFGSEAREALRGQRKLYVTGTSGSSPSKRERKIVVSGATVTRRQLSKSLT